MAEFALGLLEGREHEAVARRIAADPLLATDLRRWQLRLAGLDAGFADQTPPPGVLSQLERRLFAPSRATEGGWWNNLPLWRGLATAGFLVAAVAVGFNLMQPRIDADQLATQLVAALAAQEGSGIEFVALYDPEAGTVRIRAMSGTVAPDRDLELWYIEGDEAPVSMGVVPIDGRAEIVLGPEARTRIGEGVVLAVTLEQKGGSPTGAPGGPVVAAGSATPI